jgi:hypothetical protein
MDEEEKLVGGPRWWPDTRTAYQTDRRSYDNSEFDFDIPLTTPCGGWLEYFQRSPANRKKRQKGNPVS